MFWMCKAFFTKNTKTMLTKDTMITIVKSPMKVFKYEEDGFVIYKTVKEKNTKKYNIWGSKLKNTFKEI